MKSMSIPRDLSDLSHKVHTLSRHTPLPSLSSGNSPACVGQLLYVPFFPKLRTPVFAAFHSLAFCCLLSMSLELNRFLDPFSHAFGTGFGVLSGFYPRWVMLAICIPSVLLMNGSSRFRPDPTRASFFGFCGLFF